MNANFGQRFTELKYSTVFFRESQQSASQLFNDDANDVTVQCSLCSAVLHVLRCAMPKVAARVAASLARWLRDDRDNDDGDDDDDVDFSAADRLTVQKHSADRTVPHCTVLCSYCAVMFSDLLCCAALCTTNSNVQCCTARAVK